MEGVAGWHGKVPNLDELTKALSELGLTNAIPVQKLLDRAKQYQAEVDRKLDAIMPHFTRVPRQRKWDSLRPEVKLHI